jgi:hypothetical protein
VSKKILILLPDGVSLRNYAYTSFYSLGIEKGYDVVFWNATPFDLNSLGFSSIDIQNPKPHWLTDIQKVACKNIELYLFSKRNNDPIYYSYAFPLRYSSVKEFIKSSLIKFFTKWYVSEKGLLKLRNNMRRRERKTRYYQDCLNTLKSEKPDLVFCTSQRSIISVAPLTASQDLGIPTVAFIFSWDNVPKATTVVTTDYYFVWSEHMKQELIHYQKYIEPEQIKVTGTPQFENHFNSSVKETREVFFKTHGLDLNKEYICFSGDDVTTSPTDDFYLRDLAAAVKALNDNGQNLGIIFRRCPVDFSERYNTVLKVYEDIIVSIQPAWEKIGDSWSTILPTKEDLALQTNIIAHTACVVNLGSSMVFDYACYDKPCAFVNYNYLNPSKQAEEGVYVYDYVHFRSMPSKKAVVWLSDPEDIGNNLLAMLAEEKETLAESKKWFEKINLHPPQDASERIWDAIEKLEIND